MFIKKLHNGFVSYEDSDLDDPDKIDEGEEVKEDDTAAETEEEKEEDGGLQEDWSDNDGPTSIE